MTFQPPHHGRSNSDSSNKLTTTYAARQRKRTAHAVSNVHPMSKLSGLTLLPKSVTLAVQENLGMSNVEKSRVVFEGGYCNFQSKQLSLS
jgi:hypothetical protein